MLDLKTTVNKKLLYTVFTLYAIIAIWIIVFKVNKYVHPDVMEYFRSVSWTQRFTKDVIPGYSLWHNLKRGIPLYKSDQFLNVLAFLPYGMVLPFFVKKKTYLKAMLIIFFTSLAFEIEQVITCIGGFDTTDILANLLGGATGLLIYRFIVSKVKPFIVNMIILAIIIIAFPFAVYGIVNTILHFDIYL